MAAYLCLVLICLQRSTAAAADESGPADDVQLWTQYATSESVCFSSLPPLGVAQGVVDIAAQRGEHERRVLNIHALGGAGRLAMGGTHCGPLSSIRPENMFAVDGIADLQMCKRIANATLREAVTARLAQGGSVWLEEHRGLLERVRRQAAAEIVARHRALRSPTRRTLKADDNDDDARADSARPRTGHVATVRGTERSGARAPRPGLPRRMSLAHHGSDSLVGADTPRHEATELPRAVDGEAVCWESCDNSSTAAVVSSWEHRVGLGQGESATLHCHRPGY
jgi:hypothetical protein